MNPADAFPRTTQPPPPNHALLPQNSNVVQIPAPNGPTEGGWGESFADPERPQDPHHVNVAYHGMQPTVPYVLPNVGLQGIAAQGQPIPPNREYDRFGYAPQHVAPGLAPAQALPFGHRVQVPAPGQAGAENIRRFASRYLHHPSSRVDMIGMEPVAAGGFKVMIILEVSDVL